MRGIFVFLFIVGLVGCQNSNSKMSFSEEKMIDILVDIHVAEGALTVIPKDSIELKRAQYMHKIAQIHKTSIPEIEKNLAKLQKKVDRLKAIQKTVVHELKSKKSDLDEENVKEMIQLK